ncbi:hypothetical protein KC542_028395, partial [Klebsiella pneumoniae subsp. pneumoniae]
MDTSTGELRYQKENLLQKLKAIRLDLETSPDHHEVRCVVVRLTAGVQCFRFRVALRADLALVRKCSMWFPVHFRVLAHSLTTFGRWCCGERWDHSQMMQILFFFALELS